MFTPIAFLVASLLAGVSAFSYAELAVRFPKSAGEAVYIQQGLRSRPMAIFVSLLTVLVGMTSTATLLNGPVEYINEFISNTGYDFLAWKVG